MELRKEGLKKVPEHRLAASKRRFQIVKLEERIAPGCRWHAGQQRYVGNGNHCR